MSAQLKWTLLLVGCIVGPISGRLPKPSNLTMESRNFSLLMTWLPGPEYPPNVTYNVTYKIAYKAVAKGVLMSTRLKSKVGKATNNTQGNQRWGSWKRVPACINVTVTKCDLTCVLWEHYHQKHTVRVRAVSPLLHRSPWAELEGIDCMFTVEPGPPILHITQGESNVYINASVQTPYCMPMILRKKLKYSVEVMRNNNPKQIILEEKMNESSIPIKTHGFEGEYCFVARTIYVTDTTKESTLSNPVCKIFTQKDKGHHLQLLIGLSMALLFIPCVMVTACITWYKITPKTKTPKVLDFSSNKYYLKVSNLPVLSLETDQQIAIYNKMDQASSPKFVLSSEDNVSANNNPYSGCGYMQRHIMQDNLLKNDFQTGDSVSHDYLSSKDSSTNSNSDKSSSDCNCGNTSGSSTEMPLTLEKIQINDCAKAKEINLISSGESQTLSPTNKSMCHLIDNVCVLDSNGIGNVPLDTLCIADNNDQMESSNDESCNRCFTDSEDSLEQLTSDITDCEMSDSYIASKDEKPQNNCSSGYKQRSYMSRGF